MQFYTCNSTPNQVGKNNFGEHHPVCSSASKYHWERTKTVSIINIKYKIIYVCEREMYYFNTDSKTYVIKQALGTGCMCAGKTLDKDQM